MTDTLLTLNAGSSSLKFALFDAAQPGKARLSGLIDAIGTGGDAKVKLRGQDGEVRHEGPLAGRTHTAALQAMTELLAKQAGDARIVAVGHRIVHGGTRFAAPVMLDEAQIAEIEALAPLAPLHQPHNVAGVRAALAAFPGVPQVACFDTAFHSAQPPVHQRFAIPARWHDEGIRRYGFHGLSYESICAQLEGAPGRTVVAHLGNGASMCAIQDGRSIATTMSFSPLDGLPMGTRCGRIDAAVVLHLITHHGLSPDEVTTLLFRESGLLGMSGEASDMRTLEASPAPAAAEAIAYFVEHVLQELATMAAALRGIDRFVFTGGIGENAVALRERIVLGAAWMSLALDAGANRRRERCISAPGSAVEILVLATDEEAAIAGHVAQVAVKAA